MPSRHGRFYGWVSQILGCFSQIQLAFFKSGYTYQTLDILLHGDVKLHLKHHHNPWSRKASMQNCVSKSPDTSPGHS